MTKLSDTQLVMLTAACSRDDRSVLPLPSNLKGGAAKKVVHSLISKGLVEEVAAGPDEPVWTGSDGDSRTTLRATDAAFAALNLEPHEAPAGADGGEETEAATMDATPADEAPVGPTTPATSTSRAGSKQAQLIEMLFNGSWAQPPAGSQLVLVEKTGVRRRHRPRPPPTPGLDRSRIWTRCPEVSVSAGQWRCRRSGSCRARRAACGRERSVS